MKKANKTYGYDSIFPRRLRAIMDNNKTTQETIAKECGVARQAVSQWRDGNTRPDILSLHKIAEFYHVSADYLLGVCDLEPPNIESEKSKEFDCDVFRERVFSLMEKRNVTIKQIVNAREGEISFAWFSKLKKNDIKSPSADIVFTLADYFGVSTDYLLGLSDVPAPNTDTRANIKAVCEYTGLSERSVIALKGPLCGELVDKATVNKVIESSEFWAFIRRMKNET